MIKVDGLFKSFYKKGAVTDLSFSVQPGEVLGLLGPNGAGKTTTLRAIAGIMNPDRGAISVGGFDITKSPVEAKSLLAYLPDQPVFFHHLNCWEHVRFVANVFGVPNYEEKARKLFERFELTEKIAAFPVDLSKGMKQRLGIICSLIHSPKAILFDEPLTGLDPRGIRTVNEIIREESERGTAIILSSHLLSILEEVCTKVLVMDKGQCRLYGTIEELRSMTKDLKKDASLEEMFFYATKKDVA
jgi:ABC-2 type transport system ATP-binding protein